MQIHKNDDLTLFHSRCSSKRVRDLWWQGLPPSVRGKVWSLAIGNELNITDGMNVFYVCFIAHNLHIQENITLDIFLIPNV